MWPWTGEESMNVEISMWYEEMGSSFNVHHSKFTIFLLSVFNIRNSQLFAVLCIRRTMMAESDGQGK